MRSLYWDWISGLCILAVIAIHALGQVIDPNDSLSVLTASLQVVNFAVPIFLARAGFFSGFKPGESIPGFYLSRAARLLPPYLMASSVYVGIQNPSELASPRFLYLLATGQSIEIGYFLIVLGQMILLTPFLARLSLRGHICAMALTTIVGVGFTYIVQLRDFGVVSNFPFRVLPFFVWAPFYQLGMLFRRWPPAKIAPPAIIALCIVALIASIGEAWFWLERGEFALGAGQVKITSFAYSLALFTLFSTMASDRLWPGARLIAWFGESSYPIYLWHLLVLGAVNILLQSALMARSSFLYALAAWLLCAAISAAVLTALQFALPNRILRIALGISKRSPTNRI